MLRPPIPADEEARLEALRCYQILDSPPEREFDELAHLAAHVARTPMALVSLIDRDRQWFKARVNVSSRETTRDVSFCAHAILQPDRPLIVTDPQGDPRFAANPDVVGGLHIRFYAGFPLVASSGHALGTLCVFDSKPNKLDEEQTACLAMLARQVGAQLELRKAGLDLERARTRLMERERSLALHDLVMGVAHELNNPLMSMELAARSTLARVRRGGPVDGAPIVEDQERVLRGAARLSRIASTLLRITKRANRAPPELVDVDALLRSVAAAHPTVALDLGIGELPRVLASPDDLREIARTLIENAVESLPEGRGRVVLRSAAIGRQVRFLVSDEGGGISPEARARVFTPFFSTKEGRAGCSLAIARRCAEDAGGRIWFEGEPGKGTTFVVELPRA